MGKANEKPIDKANIEQLISTLDHISKGFPGQELNIKMVLLRNRRAVITAIVVSDENLLEVAGEEEGIGEVEFFVPNVEEKEVSRFGWEGNYFG